MIRTPSASLLSRSYAACPAACQWGPPRLMLPSTACLLVSFPVIPKLSHISAIVSSLTLPYCFYSLHFCRFQPEPFSRSEQHLWEERWPDRNSRSPSGLSLHCSVCLTSLSLGILHCISCFISVNFAWVTFVTLNLNKYLNQINHVLSEILCQGSY